MTDRRPNVVVLMADDHRGQELSHLELAQARTPVLDSLAARGVSFTNAHCQGSMVGAVCTPSRACLMTGRSIFAASNDPTGGDTRANYTIPEDLPTFPQALRQAGYHTHAVGKWHNDGKSYQRSFSSGEHIMFQGMSDHDKVPTWPFDPAGEYPGAHAFREDPAKGAELGVKVAKGFSSEIFADAAIDFIGRDRGDDPFMLYVAFTAPHDPRTPPPGWEVDPESIELPPNFMPEHPFDNGELRVRDELLAGFPRTEAEVRQHIADYYGMIAHLDHSIGRILASLDALGLAENTIVIYTGDHGLSVGQHGLMGKQNVYEHSLRVPLVMAGPGIPSGIVSDALVWHADTTATIRELTGLEPNPDAEGVALIGGDEQLQATRDYLGAAYSYGQRTIRDARYKLIRYTPIPDDVPTGGHTPGSDMVQLFDLQSDPWETVNLATDPAYTGIVTDLSERLRTWRTEIGDVMPVSV